MGPPVWEPGTPLTARYRPLPTPTQPAPCTWGMGKGGLSPDGAPRSIQALRFFCCLGNSVELPVACAELS